MLIPSLMQSWDGQVHSPRLLNRPKRSWGSGSQGLVLSTVAGHSDRLRVHSSSVQLMSFLSILRKSNLAHCQPQTCQGLWWTKFHRRSIMASKSNMTSIRQGCKHLSCGEIRLEAFTSPCVNWLFYGVLVEPAALFCSRTTKLSAGVMRRRRGALSTRKQA